MAELNEMHFLRRWAAHNKAQVGGLDPDVTLTAGTARMIAKGLWTLFGMSDAAWELVAKRGLTDEEKWGPEDAPAATRCSDCGQPVPDIFDHVASDCTGITYSDSLYRIKEVIKSLEAGHPALPIGFAQLAHDLRMVIREEI